uniref:Uncharacterized protein n=1 Tax=Pithovirus LCPAC201 TaxID=2506591 RepID=A0A481Z572_9VIRU|nr:MAG: hypothetical protein LCPAC201_00470 [Pithovirus LCPAC201]
MDCPYILLPLAQVFGYDLNRGCASGPKKYQPKPIRTKSRRNKNPRSDLTAIKSEKQGKNASSGKLFEKLPSLCDGVLSNSKNFVELPSARYNNVLSDNGRGFPQETLPSLCDGVLSNSKNFVELPTSGNNSQNISGGRPFRPGESLQGKVYQNSSPIPSGEKSKSNEPSSYVTRITVAQTPPKISYPVISNSNHIKSKNFEELPSAGKNKTKPTPRRDAQPSVRDGLISVNLPNISRKKDTSSSKFFESTPSRSDGSLEILNLVPKPIDGRSEITGLFPYILNSIRDSPSEDDSFTNCIPIPRRSANRIIDILNLPENQIPQTSSGEPNPVSSIPSINPSMIFGRKNIPKSKLTRSENKSHSKEGTIEDKVFHSEESKNDQPRQLTPISKMLREKSGLGPDVIDLDQSLHGSRIREYGSVRSDRSMWSARNSVRQLLGEVIDSYQISPKIPISSSTKKPKIKHSRIIDHHSDTKTPRKLKGILRQPTPRFYSDRVKDNSKNQIEDYHRQDTTKLYLTTDEVSHRKPYHSFKGMAGVMDSSKNTSHYRVDRSRLSDNSLSERRVKVGKLIENITVKD